MIIKDSVKNKATISGIAGTGEFKIRNSSKAFSILSDKLYSNKIRAIIRELSTNAIDSHKEAGTLDTQFELTLPNAMASNFAIRDYGMGLSHDQVMSLYTTYFDSTKNNSNDFVGSLGLGSKSPFAYTDNFTITAIKDGQKNVYIAYINDDGVPSVAHTGGEDTDEHPGVEIKFAVNSEDHRSFRDEAKSVFRFIEHQPIVHGHGDDYFEFDKPYEYRMITSKIGAITQDTRYGMRSMAIMGGIEYPLDLDAVFKTDRADGKTSGNVYERMPFYGFFDIGDLDIQPSREGLSYTKSTIETIRSALDEAHVEFEKTIVNDIKKETNYWKQCSVIEKLIEQFDVVKQNIIKVAGDVGNPFYIDSAGATINHYGTRDIELDPVDLVDKYNAHILRYSFKGVSGQRIQKIRKLTNRSHYANNNPTLNIPMAASASRWGNLPEIHPVFIKAKETRGLVTRVSEHYRGTNKSQFYVIVPVDDTKPVDYDGVIKELYDPLDVIDYDDIPKIKAGPRGGSVDDTEFMLMRNRMGESRWFSDSDVLDSDDTILYVDTKGKSPADYTGTMTELCDQLRGARIIFGGDSVYAVKKSQQKLIEGKDNWVNIKDKITKLANEMVDDTSLTTSLSYPILTSEALKNALEGTELGKDLPTDLYSWYNVRNLFRDFGISTDIIDKIVAQIEKNNARFNQIGGKYPLLKAMDAHVSDEYTLQAIAEYVKLIEDKS